MVGPLVQACTSNDEYAVAYWRWRHDVLVEVYDELSSRERPDGTPWPAQMVSAQLPADVHAFTGRAAELAKLDRLLIGTTNQAAAAGERATAMVISAVSGTAGVGKTALALRWAHRVRSAFPDGQLYVNLRGYDPGQPMSAGDALAGFLRALGMAGQDIPLRVDERATAYRSLLVGRRILVVLDNAATVEQVRPLLPGAPSCLVVVTSRDTLAGLVARHGARRLDLDLLPLHDAVALLRVLIGERVEDEPDAAAALAEQCARLPLALRVAAELAANRAGTSIASLIGELANEQRRLDLLDAGGDPRTAVRAVFSWSYHHLPAQAAQAFRLLALHPGPDHDPYAAAALTNTALEQAQHLLNLLTRGHLIQPTDPGRYGMHDLLRAYAIQLADTEDSEQQRRAALSRLFDHYLATAAAAMDTLHPAEQHRRPRTPQPATPSPLVADQTTAQVWLDTERAALTTTCAYAAAHGWSGHTILLATTLCRYLETGGYYPDSLSIHTHALQATRHIGDRSAEAQALRNLGSAHFWQGRYQQATDHLQRALTLFHEIGDQTGEARALGNLGNVYWRQGRYDEAIDHHQQALTLFCELGDRNGEAITLGNLGAVYWQQGHYQRAADHHQQALTLARELGDRSDEARALTNLGGVYWRQGHYQRAADHHQQALVLFHELGDRVGEAIALTDLGSFYWRQGSYEQAADHHQHALALFRETGDRAGEARGLTDLGDIYWRQGRYEHAADHHQQALTLARELGDRHGETEALNGLGETYHAIGQLHEAHIKHTAALALATQIGERYEQARAHNGLGRTHHTTGDPDQARHHWLQALARYTDLGVPEAHDVQAHLTALDQAAADDNED